MSVSCSCHKIKETPTESYRFCSSCNHQWADLWQDVKDGLSSENLIEYKTDHQFRDLVKDNIEIVFCERFCLYGQKLNNRHRVKLGSTYVKLSQNRQPHICLMGDYQRDKRIVEFMKYFCRFCLFFKMSYHHNTLPKRKRGGSAIKKIKLIPELLNTTFFRMSHKDEVELARQIKEQYTDFIKKRASMKNSDEPHLLKRKIDCQPLQEVKISSLKLSNDGKISFFRFFKNSGFDTLPFSKKTFSMVILKFRFPHPQQPNAKPKTAQSNQSNQLCVSQSAKDKCSAKISYGKNNQSNMPSTIFNLISKPIKFNFVPVMLLLNRIAYEHSLAVETCCFQSSLADQFPLKKKVRKDSSLPFCSQRIEQIFLPSHQTNKIILLDPQIKKAESYLCSNYTMKSTRISYSTIPVSNILKNFVDVINAKHNFFNDLSNYTLDAQQNFLCRKYREFANYWHDWKSSHYQSLNRKFPFQAYETQVCDKISGRVKLCTSLFETLVKNFGDFQYKNLKPQENSRNTGRCLTGSSVNNLIKENLTKILTAQKLQTFTKKSPENLPSGNPGKMIFEQYLNNGDFEALEVCLDISKNRVNEFLKIFRNGLEKALRIDILFSYDPSDRTFCLLSNSKNQLTSNYYFSLDTIQTQLVFQDKDSEANDTIQKNNRSFRACFDRIINELSRLSDYQKYSAYVYIMNKIFIKCRYKEIICLEQLMFDLGRKKTIAPPNNLATNLLLALKNTMVQLQEDFNFVIYLDRIMKLGYYDHMKLGSFIDDVLSIYDDLVQRRIFEVSRKFILDPRFGFFDG